MNKLSTGQNSTLGSYLMLCDLLFGKDSAQYKFVESKINESPNGANEEVIAHESQMLYLLATLK